MDREMGGSSCESYSHRPQRLDARIMTSKNKLPKNHLVVTASEHITAKALNCITSMKKCVQTNGAAGNVVMFCITTAALEIVRRLSKSKFPFIWRGLQALQVICYPPFKSLQRWFPFSPLAKEMKKISGPMLFLSIATVFSDHSSSSAQDPSCDSNVSQAPESQLQHSLHNCSETSFHHNGPDACQSEKWLLDLHNKLRMEGITLTERLNDDEIHRFYTSTKGDFERTFSLIKKTIQWRLSFSFLSPQELQAWSHLVFWHGFDLKKRPCLVIRLGLACSNLSASERDSFTRVIVSQIEHGVVSLVDLERPQIVVLMDCEGLSPFGFPLQMMRSCATLLQDHYPNCLGSLIVVRIPHIAQVVIQTLFQVLRPGTRRKVTILGRNYQEYLANNLESVPFFLGGNCSCSKCSAHGNEEVTIEEIPSTGSPVNDDSPEFHHHTVSTNINSSQKPLKMVAIGLVVVWILIAIILGTHCVEWVPSFYWKTNS